MVIESLDRFSLIAGMEMISLVAIREGRKKKGSAMSQSQGTEAEPSMDWF